MTLNGILSPALHGPAGASGTDARGGAEGAEGVTRPTGLSWLSEGPRGPPLAFRTVHESFPSHGSSVAGPCPGDLPRASTTEAVHARSEAGKLGVGSLQAPRSGSCWGGDPHSYRDVSVGL